MSPEEAETLGKAYFTAFKAYKDNEIQEAADDYVNTGEYFPPKPAHIIGLVKNSDIGRHTRELVERYTCSACKQRVSAISEGVCLDCLGIPDTVYTKPPLPEPTPVDYVMEGRMVCQMCGHIGMAIKEPANTGQWLCRKCYTGMTNHEIAAAFKTLGGMIG